jgi:serine/threonine protein phosphatase PrpC
MVRQEVRHEEDSVNQTLEAALLFGGSAPPSDEPSILVGEPVPTYGHAARGLKGEAGGVAYFACPSPDRPEASQDRGLLWIAADGRCVLAVADGVGGIAGGARAAETALQCLLARLQAIGAGSLRTAVLDGFEEASGKVLALGSGRTTLVAVSIEDGILRSFHAGDSAALVVGRRGSLKHQTISHSPVGYAVESGLIDEEAALEHEERHIVSNLIGDEECRIEIGHHLRLAPFDTVILGSDGLFDNLSIPQIVECARRGPLLKVATDLASASLRAMNAEGADQVGKADDLTFLLLRQRARL